MTSVVALALVMIGLAGLGVTFLLMRRSVRNLEALKEDVRR